jgi:Na+/H+ antiporter NhaD/arsenite permease-like protein
MPELAQALLQPGALITLAVLAGSVVLFTSGWLAPEVTGLLAAGLLIASGVLTPSEALRGFGSPAVITLMGLFALSAGLFRAGGLDRLRALLGSDAIRSPRRMILLVTTVVGPVSAFVPNTPIVPPCCRCWRAGASGGASPPPGCCYRSPSPPCWGAPSP